MLLKAGFNLAPYEKDGLLPNPDGFADQPDQENYAPLGEKGERETYYLNADWITNSNFVVSGRVGFYRTNVEDTGVPFYDLTHNYYGISGFVDRHPEIPAEWQQGRGWFSNYFQSGVRAKDIYERKAGRRRRDLVLLGGRRTLAEGRLPVRRHLQRRDPKATTQTESIYYWDQAYTTVSA